MGTIVRTNRSGASVVVKKDGKITLNSLENVRIDNPANKDLLAFDVLTGTWVARSNLDVAANVDLANAIVDAGDYETDTFLNSLDCGIY